MKNSLLIALSLSILLFGCEYDEPTEPIASGQEFDFYVTGIRESITYEFESGGRIDSADEVNSLAFLVLDEDQNVVYETRYYSWYGEGAIPDTIFIPALGEGVYNVVAVTSEYFYYDYGVFEDGQYGDTAVNASNLLLPAYAVNSSPIFAGFERFVLDEENEGVQINMKNISARITMKIANGQSLGQDNALEMSFLSVNAQDYDLVNEEFVATWYSDNYLYGYIDSYTATRSIYVLPQTLKSMNMNFYDWRNGSNWSQTLDFEESLSLEVGDAITFSLDMEALLEGAGSGVLNFEDIDWNDLGEVMVP